MSDEITTTERLRALLDARSVEWEALPDSQQGEFTITATRWHDSEGGLLTMCIDDETGNTWDFFWFPTPEQAVEATLGKETYEDDDYVSVQKIVDTVDEMVVKYKIKIVLKDYYEKLQERVTELEELTDGKRYIPQEWYQLATTENEKLRELIRHMWCCMNKEYTEIGLDFICNYCGKCEYNNSCGECAFGDRMRELGIEVDK